MSGKQENDSFPPKWGLTDSDAIDQERDVKDLHLMKEGFKIVDKQGIIYAGLQFEEEKKTIAEQAQIALEAGGKVVGVAAGQVVQVSKWGFNRLYGYLQKAGDKIIGSLEGLQETYKQYKEQQKKDEQEGNKSKIQENWEMIVSNDTPQEDIDVIKKQIEEDGGTIKITRVQQAVHLQKMNSNERIIQLQESSMSFKMFVENQQSRIQQQDFGLLDSDNIDLRGAIMGIENSMDFERIKREQDEFTKNQEFDWSKVFNPHHIMNQEGSDNQNNQQFENQNYPNVIQVNTVLNNNEHEQIFNPNQYNNFMKVNIPQINPYQGGYNNNNNYQQQDFQAQENQYGQQQNFEQNYQIAQQNNEVQYNNPIQNANNYNNQPQDQNQYYFQQQQQQNYNQQQQINNYQYNQQYINQNNNKNQYQSEYGQLEEPMAN